MHKNAPLKLFYSVLNTSLEVALFPFKILFWLPRLYHLIFLFWEERQKAPLGLLYKKSCSWEFRKIHRKTPVSESLLSLFPSEVCNFIQERLRLRCFPVNSAKCKNSCLEEHLRTAVSEKIYNYRSITVKNMLPDFFYFSLNIFSIQRLKRTWRNFDK